MFALDEVVRKIRGMIKTEEAYAISLSASVEELKNLVVKEILESVAQDSRKHAGLYRSIMSLVKAESPAIVEEDYNRLETIIKKHIEVENEMMRNAKQLLKTELDSRIRHLLLEIHEDEVRHHALMKRLLEVVIKHEVIFEKDVWDMIWKDVPGHGAPIS
jgi:rubrerythrin